MADNLLAKVTEYFAAQNSRVGKTINDHLQALKELGFPSNLETATNESFSISCMALAATETFEFAWVAPYKCQISAIWGSRAGAVAGTVTCTIAANGNNPLDGTNVDIAALTTAGVAEEQLLSGTVGNLVVAAGQQIKFTFAAAGASSLAGGGNIVIHVFPAA